MSYARYSSSAWYIFWSGAPDDDTYDDQRLEVHSTYRPLGEEWVLTPQKAKDWLVALPSDLPGSEAEQDEVREAIRAWFADLAYYKIGV